MPGILPTAQSFLAIFLLFFTEVPTFAADMERLKDCQANEQFLQCGTCESSCKEPIVAKCRKECKPPRCECQSKLGFVRAHDGACIRANECSTYKGAYFSSAGQLISESGVIKSNAPKKVLDNFQQVSGQAGFGLPVGSGNGGPAEGGSGAAEEHPLPPPSHSFVQQQQQQPQFGTTRVPSPPSIVPPSFRAKTTNQQQQHRQQQQALSQQQFIPSDPGTFSQRPSPSPPVDFRHRDGNAGGGGPRKIGYLGTQLHVHDKQATSAQQQHQQQQKPSKMNLYSDLSGSQLGAQRLGIDRGGGGGEEEEWNDEKAEKGGRVNLGIGPQRQQQQQQPQKGTNNAASRHPSSSNASPPIPSTAARTTSLLPTASHRPAPPFARTSYAIRPEATANHVPGQSENPIAHHTLYGGVEDKQQQQEQKEQQFDPIPGPEDYENSGNKEQQQQQGTAAVLSNEASTADGQFADGDDGQMQGGGGEGGVLPSASPLSAASHHSSATGLSPLVLPISGGQENAGDGDLAQDDPLLAKCGRGGCRRRSNNGGGGDAQKALATGANRLAGKRLMTRNEPYLYAYINPPQNELEMAQTGAARRRGEGGGGRIDGASGNAVARGEPSLAIDRISRDQVLLMNPSISPLAPELRIYHKQRRR